MGEEGSKPRKADKVDKSHIEQAGRAALTYLPPDMRSVKQVRCFCFCVYQLLDFWGHL